MELGGYGTIMVALKEKTVEDQIKDMVHQDKIKIVDKQDNVIEIKQTLGLLKKQTHRVVSNTDKDNLLGDDDFLEEDDLHMDIEDGAGVEEGVQAQGMGETKTHLVRLLVG